MPLGASWDISWALLGGILGRLGGLLAVLGALRRLECLGEASWGRLGPSWEPLEGLLGSSWGHLGAI